MRETKEVWVYGERGMATMAVFVLLGPPGKKWQRARALMLPGCESTENNKYYEMEG